MQEVRIQRDLFGRILGISIDHKVDLAKILSYPITPLPLSLCHFDGSICKTQKSILLKCLKGDIEYNPPSHIDIVVIDSKNIWQYLKENVTNGYTVEYKKI